MRPQIRIKNWPYYVAIGGVVASTVAVPLTMTLTNYFSVKAVMECMDKATKTLEDSVVERAGRPGFSWNLMRSYTNQRNACEDMRYNSLLKMVMPKSGPR